MRTTRKLFDPRTPSNHVGIHLDCRHTSLVAQAGKFQLNYPDGAECRFLQLQFAKEKDTIDSFAGDLFNKQKKIEELIESLADCEFNLDLISAYHKGEIKALTDRANADLELVRKEIRSAQEIANYISNQFKAHIRESNWQKSNKANEEQAATQKKELSKKGAEEMAALSSLIDLTQP
jgi:hypothetical protein